MWFEQEVFPGWVNLQAAEAPGGVLSRVKEVLVQSGGLGGLVGDEGGGERGYCPLEEESGVGWYA